MSPATGTDLFIGREREMAELTAAFEGALDGRGGLVMLAGEPGIGKTRLTEELTEVARDRGAVVTSGVCYEGGSAPPYWPWTQAIRSLLTEPSEATLNALNPRAAVIAEIVPEIREMMPDLQPAPELDPPQARFRLFDAVTSFLDGVASSQPLVVVLDDLHWADRSTLDLLEFVAREISSRPMLIIGGYRDMELSRRHPLSESLATLARVRGFERTVLRGLESSEVGRLVEAVGDISLPAELIEEIYVRTEGNPFFISEVTRDMAREAAERGGDFDALKFRIPEGVREAVGIRLNKLSEECNEVLRTAAVIGREFDFTLLAAVIAERSEAELLDVVHEALGAATIRELPVSGERYEFTHALIQQTLAEELSISQRTRLHARVVDALEQLFEDHLEDHSAELAFHCSEAGTAAADDSAMKYARMAGERAATSYAWIEARVYFEQALDAQGTDAPPADRAAVLFGLGRAELESLTYPDIQRGWDNIAGAFDLYEEFGDSRAAVAVAIQSHHSETAHVHGSARVFSRALEMVPSESVEAGHLLKMYGGAIRYEQEDTAGSLKALDQALEISRRSGDRRLETGVLADQSEFRHRDFDDAGAVGLGLQAIELARETDQPGVEASSHFILAVALVALGDSDAAWQHTEAQLRVHAKIGRSQDTPLYVQYIISYLRGDLLKMDEIGGVLDRESPGDTVKLMLVGIGAWHAGKQSGLETRIRAALEDARSGPLTLQRVANLRYLALAARLMDRPADAVRAGELAQTILAMAELTPADEANARIAAGLAAVATGDAQGATDHYQHLKDLRGSGFGWPFPICADRLLGLLAHTAAMQDEAAAHFGAALKFTSKAGYRLEEAWTCHDYAGSLLDRGEQSDGSSRSTNSGQAGSGRDAEKAASLIEDGVEITEELGLVALENRLITLRQKSKLMSAPAAVYPDGLTSREVEVLRLLAAGRTNQQIADDLVIAPSTAAKHVANILGKTGSANRAEAGAYAHEHSLTAAQQGAD